MNGYRARWRGASYEAFPDGELVRLYSTLPVDGFALVRDERYCLVVPVADVERLEYVRPMATWHGEPFLVRSSRGGRAELEYVGGNAGVAARLGCERADRGVYRVRVAASELTDVREDVVVLSF